MAEVRNKTTGPLATDEAGMMADAKAYAKSDYYIVKQFMEVRLDKVLTPDEENEIAKQLIDAKLVAIKKSRMGVNSNFN